MTDDTTSETTSETSERASRKLREGIVVSTKMDKTAVVAVVFLAWTQVDTGDPGSAVAFAAAALALVGGVLAARSGREGWAFIGTFATIGLAVAGLFLALFPDVMPSTTDAAYSLTTTNASATEYTLKVMTVVALIFTPIVLCYQAWTYWVFRKRIADHHIPDPELEAVH